MKNPVEFQAVTAELGLCMEGNRAALQRWLRAAWLACPDVSWFNYLEIGIAEGKTLQALGGALAEWSRSEMAGQRGVLVTGVDLIDGWSVDWQQVADRVRALDVPFALYNEGSPEFLKLVTPEQEYHFALVDGCHGYACARRDFEQIAPWLAEGAVVAFHDADRACQGMHRQPHCGTGIDVRHALLDLGLLNNTRPGWQKLEEVGCLHGCAFFQRISGDPKNIL